MNITDNTLQNYLTKYIEQTLSTYTSGNRYNKLHRELLSKVAEIIKLTVREAKHHDSSLESIYNGSKFNKKLIHAIAKQQVSTFLDTHSIKKEVVAGFNNEHHINGNDLKILEEAEDIVNQINNINLLQHNKENEELNIRKTLAQSINMPSVEKHKLEHARQ